MEWVNQTIRQGGERHSRMHVNTGVIIPVGYDDALNCDTFKLKKKKLSMSRLAL